MRAFFRMRVPDAQVFIFRVESNARFDLTQGCCVSPGREIAANRSGGGEHGYTATIRPRRKTTRFPESGAHSRTF